MVASRWRPLCGASFKIAVTWPVNGCPSAPGQRRRSRRRLSAHVSEAIADQPEHGGAERGDGQQGSEISAGLAGTDRNLTPRPMASGLTIAQTINRQCRSPPKLFFRFFRAIRRSRAKSENRRRCALETGLRRFGQQRDRKADRQIGGGGMGRTGFAQAATRRWPEQSGRGGSSVP